MNCVGTSNRNWAHGVRCAALGTLLAGLLVAGSGCASEILATPGHSRQQGVKLYNEGSYADAAGAFTNAIKQDPRDYESYYYLGRTYESMKNFHQSVSHYRTALDVMANHLRGREDKAFRLKVIDSLASAIAAGGDPALEQVGMSGKSTPSAEDHLILAKVHRIQGDADSALESYQQASLLAPDDAAIAKEYGLYLLQLNQRQHAATELRRAYVLNYRGRKPEDPQVTDGLRQAGVVPGPALGEEKDLRQPPVPRGPLPEVDLTKIAG